MLLIECANGHKAFTESGADPDAALSCPPGSGCCEEDHHHGRAANSCPGGHGACPVPDSCPVWLGMQPHLPESPLKDTSAGPCPGGHCGAGVSGCVVCRPVTITLLPGSVTVRRAES